MTSLISKVHAMETVQNLVIAHAADLTGYSVGGESASLGNSVIGEIVLLGRGGLAKIGTRSWSRAEWLLLIVVKLLLNGWPLKVHSEGRGLCSNCLVVKKLLVS